MTNKKKRGRRQEEEKIDQEEKKRRKTTRDGILKTITQLKFPSSTISNSKPYITFRREERGRKTKPRREKEQQ